MIDVKQATESAAIFFNEVYHDKGVSDARLEEVEITEDGKYWLITLSFQFPSSKNLLGLPVDTNREYRIFKVDAQTGQALSMKIRELEYGLS